MHVILFVYFTLVINRKLGAKFTCLLRDLDYSRKHSKQSISSFQHRLSPSEGGWKMRTNDLAKRKLEILIGLSRSYK
jgi:hypothetical protein